MKPKMEKSNMAKKRLETTRTSRGLRDTLFEELDMLRNGESDAPRAAAVAKLAVQIINTAMIEVTLQRTDLNLGATADTAVRVRPIQLGRLNA
jgi:hypothetical protein